MTGELLHSLRRHHTKGELGLEVVDVKSHNELDITTHTLRIPLHHLLLFPT